MPPFSVGTKVGPYEIVGALGAGGMGDVYRARDTKLNREIALKILPEAFASDPDRLARFTREAQTLAALNHPHIAHIHGLEESGSTRALVMELVEGEDLAHRLERGPIPIDEAVPIARQIAEALEAAHEQGIVHRDLKPANVKVKTDGTVKVLDFGLAKAVEGAVGADGSRAAAGLTNSPTLTSPARMTAMGVILGTAAYMAPEQAKGKPIDKRVDIWAFGAVVFEMLTGKPLFEGETVSEVLAAVIMKAPDLSSLPASVPELIRALLGRCLERDPKLRLRDIGEARLALTPQSGVGVSSFVAQPSVAPPVAVSSAAVPRWLALVLAVLIVALGATGTLLWRAQTTTVTQPVTQFEVRPLDQTALAIVNRPNVAVSPGGSTFVFVAATDGVPRLYSRKREEIEPHVIPNTEGASNPVFSPDGAEIAFFVREQLKKTRLDGSAMVVAQSESAAADPRGMTWLDDGSIVYAPDVATGLVRVAGTGGAPQTLTAVIEKNGERTHRWPSGLPGSKAVLFTVGTIASPDNYDEARIEAVVLGTGERRLVLEGASSARYVATGHLLFSRGSGLYAVPFDVDSLTIRGSQVQVLQDVDGDATTGASHLSISTEGTLAYAPGHASAGQQHIVWVDRSGASQPVDLPVGIYSDMRISPDGTRVAMTWQSVTGSTGDIWVHDFVRKTFTRLSFSGSVATPIWSADGKTIYFMYIDPAGRKSTIMRRPADGSRDAEVVSAIDTRAYVNGISPDGTTALIDYRNLTGGTSGSADVVNFPLAGDAKLVRVTATPSDEFASEWSLDRRWLAYQSNETGRYEVYVRGTAEGSGRWQISTAGGEEPHWSRDGRHLYFRNDTALMSVEVDTRGTFTPKSPVKQFEGIYNLRSDTGLSYAVDPKNDRFLMIRLAGDNGSRSSVRVVLNWFQELRRLTQTGS